MLKWGALLWALSHASQILAVPTTGPEIAKRDTAKYVFAHFMVGIVENYEVDDWKRDMAYAQEIGIDAFALNNANIDSYTPKQLANAYQAAEEVGFKCFISFDFAYWSNGNTANITDYMNMYAGHPAQMQYNDGAIVSTFVGDSFNWAPVKAGVNHKITALPNLQDPAEVNSEQTGFDGAFSWYAWPTDGGNSIIPGPMTTIWDDKFVANLAGRPYMAPVSPWFSTHFNSKNWVFICEQLITDRWNEMLALKPSLIEIVTWNDYGESHYIGPDEPNHSDDGSSQWAVGFPHDGWRVVMKPYIAAYKAGLDAPKVDADQLVYWYRPTPWDVTCTNDTLGPPNGREMLQDLVFVTTLLTQDAQLTVQSGSGSAKTINVPAGVVTNNFTMGVGPQQFSVSRNGAAVLGGKGGLDISGSCEKYNYNAYVGSFNATGSSPPPPVTSTTTKSTSTTSIKTSTSSSTTLKTTTTTTAPPPPPPTTTTTTVKVPTTTTSSPPSSSTGCTAGTGPGNYVGLCQFCCGYGYCPPGPCTCTATGPLKPAPPANSPAGRPLGGEDDSYLGLCSYACSHGYCPPTACQSG